MTVEHLIKILQRLDPQTLVVKFHEKEGYDEVWFVEGTHTSYDGDYDRLRLNRAKRVKGISRPEYHFTERGKTRARTFKFIILY